MVYEALGRLDKRGAILKTDKGRSSLYRPVPPDTLLDRIDREHHRIVKDLRSQLNPLYKSHEQELIWTIEGRSLVIAYARQMIKNANAEISVLLTDYDLEELEDEIYKGLSRGLNFNALLTGNKEIKIENISDRSRVDIASHPPIESELQDLSKMLIVITDANECLITNSNLENDLDVSIPNDHYAGTVTTNRNLVFIAKQFIWMELFTQRILSQLSTEVVDKLNPDDRQVFR